MDTGMPLDAEMPSGRMRVIMKDISREYRKGEGNQAEKLWEFRERMTKKLDVKVTPQELDRSLPAVFRPYRVFDGEEQHDRRALMEWMRRVKVEAATAEVEHRVQNIPDSVRDALPAIRYYLEKTGRKEIANEFENVMTAEPDTEIARRLRINDREGKLSGEALEEATRQEKSRRAFERGRMFAQLARDFAYKDPEDIVDAVRPNDFKMNFAEYHYLNSLAHCLENCLNADEEESEIRFTAEDRKKCLHIRSFEDVTDRFECQVDLICNPYYPYLDTGKIIRDMKPDKVRENCVRLVQEGGYFSTLGFDMIGGALAVDSVRANAIYRRTVKEKAAEESVAPEADEIPGSHDMEARYEEAVSAAQEAITGMEAAYDNEMKPLVDQVCRADPFYMVFSSPEYGKIKEHMLAYAKVRIIPDPSDDKFDMQLKEAAKETKKLIKYSRMYLKHRGVDETGKKNKKDRRIDAARAVEKFSTEQFNRLRQIAKSRKAVAAVLEEETRERDSSVSRNIAASTRGTGRERFYKSGKQLLSSGYQKADAITGEVDRRLKEMFSPDAGYDLYAVLGLDQDSNRKEPLSGEALDVANGLVECLMMKMVLRNVQDICESNGKESSISQMTGKTSYGGLRDVVCATPTYKKAIRDINAETVYGLVTGDEKSSLTELSRKVTMELSASANRILSGKQQNMPKGTELQQNVAKNTGMETAKP